MKFLVYFLVCFFTFSSHAIDNESMEAKLTKLNAQSEELLGIPIAVLVRIVEVHRRGHFVPEDVYEETGRFEEYKSLINKGYIVVETTVNPLEFSLMKDKKFVKISLTQKGLEIKNYFDNFLNIQNGLIPLYKQSR